MTSEGLIRTEFNHREEKNWFDIKPQKLYEKTPFGKIPGGLGGLDFLQIKRCFHGSENKRFSK